MDAHMAAMLVDLRVISDISTRKGECCVVLTTHSMEECEVGVL
jgi:hypothetical protein